MLPLQGFSTISGHLLHTRGSTLLDHELPIADGRCPRPKGTTERKPSCPAHLLQQIALAWQRGHAGRMRLQMHQGVRAAGPH